jgi:hypothetical protein
VEAPEVAPLAGVAAGLAAGALGGVFGGVLDVVCAAAQDARSNAASVPVKALELKVLPILSAVMALSLFVNAAQRLLAAKRNYWTSVTLPSTNVIFRSL